MQAGNTGTFSFGSLYIPPRPEVVTALMEEQAKEQPSFERIGQLIAGDVCLAAAMIKAVNSVAFGLERKLASIPQALQLLGLQRVTQVATELVTRNLANSASAGSFERFWDSAEKSAGICARIARKLHGISADEAYTYGLFHDCGIPLLMNQFPQYKNALIAANQNANQSFSACEEAAIGTSHTAVGYFLARSWNLPSELCQAILRHHEMDVFAATKADQGNRMLDFIGIGHLAEHAHHLSARSGEDIEWNKFDHAIIKHFGLADEDYQDIVEGI